MQDLVHQQTLVTGSAEPDQHGLTQDLSVCSGAAINGTRRFSNVHPSHQGFLGVFGGDPENKHPAFHSPDSQLSSQIMLTNNIDCQGSTWLNIRNPVSESINPHLIERTSVPGRVIARWQ